jgi:hypothetical protein
MNDPPRREARPSRPYGNEPGARPRGRDPGIPPGAPRTPAAQPRPPRPDPGSAGGTGDSRGSDPRGRDSGWGGRDSGARNAGGNGWDPGLPAGRGGDPGSGAPTRRMPAPKGVQGDGSPRSRGVPGGRPPGSTQPRGPDGPGDARGRRNSARPRRPRQWGALQGGLGVCIIIASAAIGAIVTMVTRSAPGFLLGFFVVAGTLAAALAVRPKSGRMIFPVPVLSYLVAALISGVVFDRSVDSSKTALAIAAAQWIANGFFAMALATGLAVAITATRWFLWRRGRPATRDPGWPVPPAGPARTDPGRTGPTRTGPTRTGPTRTGPTGTGPTGTGPPGAGPAGTGPSRAGTVQAGAGRDGAPRPPRAARETPTESGFAAGWPGPDGPRESGEADGPRRPGRPGAPGGPGGPRGSGVWGDPGSHGTSPRPGSEPYDFSSGA